MDIEKSEKINKLKEYFAGQDEVVMAFLFGSQASGQAVGRSDWDIGVYLKKEDRAIENKIWSAVEQIVKNEIDLIILNRAPATIAWSIIRQGQELSIKDRYLYIDFLLRVSDEAIDFYNTSADYYKIFQRSASISLADKARLEKIIIFLTEEIKEYDNFKSLTWEEYSNVRSKKRDVEHWIEHMVNAIIDVAKIVLASEKKIIPETYTEMIRMLEIIKPFSQGDLSKKISEWVKLRNILAHEYLDYRWKNVSEFISQTGPIWKEFLKQTEEFLKLSEKL